ncbi:MAG: hypothetical protein LBU73_08410 [Helicobacteraceae bacterium]|jgi:hypothetical protein|nr:hypothetical protein [Helicobacteraceae bacterium]
MKFDDIADVAPSKGIDAFLPKALIAMGLGFLIFMPKIYISNEIYITSTEIERSRSLLESLQDSNNRLRREMETRILELEDPYEE